MTDNSMKSIYQKRTRIGDNILKVLIYLAAGVAIALLVGIMGYVFVRGLPQVSWQLLSTVQSSLKGTFGILGNIINTIYIIVITLIIAAPIGIGSAIYLNEYAKPGKLVRTPDTDKTKATGDRYRPGCRPENISLRAAPRQPPARRIGSDRRKRAAIFLLLCLQKKRNNSISRTVTLFSTRKSIKPSCPHIRLPESVRPTRTTTAAREI